MMSARCCPKRQVSTLAWGYGWGVVWGIGGLTFGLSMRYLGMSLGYALALGLCTVFGMLMPPLFAGHFADSLWNKPSGFTVLLGLGVCVIGISISGLAGISKEREMPEARKKEAIREFNFIKGVIVATIAGVLSAAFSFGLAATKDIQAISTAHGTNALWAGLPQLIVILLGGFTTNVIWCAILAIRNNTWREYASASNAETIQTDSPQRPNASLAVNYALSAVAGLTWYFQFFFYTHGQQPDGQVRLQLVDFAHGQHHHFLDAVGAGFARVARNQCSHTHADRRWAGDAGDIDHCRRLRQFPRVDGAVTRVALQLPLPTEQTIPRRLYRHLDGRRAPRLPLHENRPSGQRARTAGSANQRSVRQESGAAATPHEQATHAEDGQGRWLGHGIGEPERGDRRNLLAGHRHRLAGDALAEVVLQREEVVEIGHAVVVEVPLIKPSSGYAEIVLQN